MVEQLIKCPDDVDRTLRKMQDVAQPGDPMHTIKKEIELIRHLISKPKSLHIKWENLFISLGRSAWDLIGSIDQNKFCSMLMNKHRLYGAEPLVAWGGVGIIIRIDSKLKRYENIIAGEKPPADESALDTLHDILGYCVLGHLAALQGAI